MAKIFFPNLGPNKVLFLFGGGALIVLFAIYAGLAGFPFIIATRLKGKLSLNDGSESMKAFLELPKPLEFKVYIFNVTNPDEVTNGAKPILEEVGPYVYDEHKKKVDVSFPDSDSMTYKVVKYYHFNQKKSGCLKESDIVTVLNIPMLGTGYMVEERFPMGLAFLNAALPYLFPNMSSPFLRVAVGDLLFDGITISCGYETGPAMPICRGMGSNLPPPIRRIPGTKDYAFSMFQAINGTTSGVFKVNRGNRNIYNLGKIQAYQNLTYLDMWDANTTCAVLKGTDATIIPPIYNREDLYLYLPEVCLSLRAVYTGEMDMHGIHVYKYVSSPDNFASADELPENKCRCRLVEDVPEPVCLKTGAIDATRCQGAPVILTPVHFLNSDPEYQNYPIGLSPNASMHETQVLVEPYEYKFTAETDARPAKPFSLAGTAYLRTGVPLAAYKRIQMNMMLRRLEGIDLLANVSQGLFPMMWVEEAIPDEMLEVYLPELNELMTAQKITVGITWLLIAVGAICITSSIVLYLKHQKMSCFKENQVVSNMSAALDKSYRKDIEDKRSVYNIPITPVQTDDSMSRYSVKDGFPENNSSFKTTVSS